MVLTAVFLTFSILTPIIGHSLVKMLYWMCEKTDMPPTGPQLLHAIKRNFGGLEESGLNTETIFRRVLVRDIDTPPDLRIIKAGVRPLYQIYSLSNACSVIRCII